MLISIPVIHGLEELYCSGCTGLTEIPVIPGLKCLYCSECPLLTKIPVISGLKKILCSECPLLTSIPIIPGLKVLNCSECPWLPQNPSNKIYQGLKLQSWIKNNFRYFVFQRWIKSNEGKEFLYHPNNIGGRIEKSKMRKTLESLNYRTHPSPGSLLG